MTHQTLEKSYDKNAFTYFQKYIPILFDQNLLFRYYHFIYIIWKMLPVNITHSNKNDNLFIIF